MFHVGRQVKCFSIEWSAKKQRQKTWKPTEDVSEAWRLIHAHQTDYLFIYLFIFIFATHKQHYKELINRRKEEESQLQIIKLKLAKTPCSLHWNSLCFLSFDTEIWDLIMTSRLSRTYEVALWDLETFVPKEKLWDTLKIADAFTLMLFHVQLQ